MQKTKAQKALEELDRLAKCVRNQNNGADIHTIGNIRNTISLLKHQIEEDPDCLDEQFIQQVIKNIEAKVVDFYKKKYNRP